MRLERQEQGGEQDQQHAERADVPNHNAIHALCTEHRVLGNFVLHIGGFGNIADQNAGHQRNDWHHNVVADVVEEIEELHFENSEI